MAGSATRPATIRPATGSTRSTGNRRANRQRSACRDASARVDPGPGARRHRTHGLHRHRRPHLHPSAADRRRDLARAPACRRFVPRLAPQGARQAAARRARLWSSAEALAASLGAIVANLLRPGDFWRAFPLIAYLALYALLLLVMAALCARIGRGIDRARMRAAAWLLILLVGGARASPCPERRSSSCSRPRWRSLGIAVDGRSPMLATILAPRRGDPPVPDVRRASRA